MLTDRGQGMRNTKKSLGEAKVGGAGGGERRFGRQAEPKVYLLRAH